MLNTVTTPSPLSATYEINIEYYLLPAAYCKRGRGSYVGKGGRVVRRVIVVGYCVPSSTQTIPALLALVHYFNCMSCLSHMNISLAGEGGILMRPQ